MDIDLINEKLNQLIQRKKQHRDEQGKFAKKTVWEVAKQHGLDTTDTRIGALASREVEDAEKAVLELAAKMYFTRPTEADMPSHVVGERPPMPRKERLQEEYEEGAKHLRGNDLIRWQAKMRAKGWKEQTHDEWKKRR